MSGKPHSLRLSAADVKSAASGRWLEVLESVAGIPIALLDGKGHPCPKCDGHDRFALIDQAAGAVICRKCFAKYNGDGLAAVAWMCGCDFRTAVKKAADHLGLTTTSCVPPANSPPRSYYSQNSSSPPSEGSFGNNGSAKPQIVAEYDYRDEAGDLVFQVVRYEPKDFRQRRPKPGGGWDWTVKGVKQVPYRLPKLLAADSAQAVFVVEGEKDAENLARIGLQATCNAGGAGKWTDDHAEFLRGRRVIILYDNDDAGHNHAQRVAHTLNGVAESVRVVELTGLPDKGDVTDWIAAGGTKTELTQLAEAAPEWEPVQQHWPEIISFDVLDLPEFPTDALPDALRRWVEAESHATQTPADLSALLALAVCSATLARRVEVQVRPDWREPVNLFTAVLLEPGNRKSAVFTDATRPLREVEAELVEARRSDVARAQSERRQSELQLRRLEKLAADKQGDEAAHARYEAGNLAVELANGAEPALPRLIVDDTTSEKLDMILAEQGGRIASMSPEGDVFDLMAGRYSKSGTPQFGTYLKGHSGDELMTDRVSRKSVRVERPALTCAYAIQPQVIVGLAENPAFRGRGLLARFLYAAPQSWIGRRAVAPAPVPAATRDAYYKVVRTLAGVTGEHVLRLTGDGAAVLGEWEREIEMMLGDGGQMEIMRDWGAKLAGATVRLAAVLHSVERGPAGRIEGPTVAAAIEIARYLIPHAEAVLNLMAAGESTSDDDARYVLRWIQRHKRHEFTRSEAQHHGKRRFPRADNIDSALAELERRGYIRLRPISASGPGRPPSPSYDVNPAVFVPKPSKTRSYNSRNSIEPSANESCGNNGSASQQPQTAIRVQVTI
jgi:hypothetical protein